MKAQAFNTTVLFYPNKNPKMRLFALWYFTILMIIWNVLGHTVLGFEQSWASPFVAIAVAVRPQVLPGRGARRLRTIRRGHHGQ